MHAACVLVNAGVTDADAEDIILQQLTREPKPNEIEDALYKARTTSIGQTFKAAKPDHQVRRAEKSAKFNAESLARIAAKLPEADETWLERRSPVPVADCTSEKFLHHLFNENEQVLIFSDFRSQGQLRWHHRGEILLPHELKDFKTGCECGVWFLSNPFDGEYRNLERLKSPRNEKGRTRRAEENVTSFRYALLESDKADPLQWLAALAQMPLPIVSIVTSGGRSLHSLVRVNARTKSDWDEIVRVKMRFPLTLLGADDGAFTAVRLTRLPGCLRYRNGEGKRYPSPREQRLLYLNPWANGTPIAELPENHQ